MRTVTVSLSVASINDESRLPTSVLFAVPTDGYNMEVSTHAMPNGLGFRSRQKQVTSPKCPDRPWGPPSGYRGLVAQEQSGQEVKLTTHVYLVPRLMNGGVTSLPYTPSRHTEGEPLPYLAGVRGRGVL